MGKTTTKNAWLIDGADGDGSLGVCGLGLRKESALVRGIRSSLVALGLERIHFP